MKETKLIMQTCAWKIHPIFRNEINHTTSLFSEILNLPRVVHDFFEFPASIGFQIFQKKWQP